MVFSLVFTEWHQPESQSDGANHHSIKTESMADGLLSASRSFHHKHDDVGVITESCTVYHRRWYILVVFSLIAGVQAAVWNTWGPITGSAEDVFGWSDGTIALLENWGPIAYIISFLLFSWLMDIKGLFLFLLKFVEVGDRILQDFAMTITSYCVHVSQLYARVYIRCNNPCLTMFKNSLYH